MKFNPYDISNKSVCPVCGNSFFVDSIGNGDKCPRCFWIKSSLNEEFPDRVVCLNLISLNKVKNYMPKVILPDFDDFIAGFNFYEEMELIIKVQYRD